MPEGSHDYKFDRNVPDIDLHQLSITAAEEPAEEARSRAFNSHAWATVARAWYATDAANTAGAAQMVEADAGSDLDFGSDEEHAAGDEGGAPTGVCTVAHSDDSLRQHVHSVLVYVCALYVSADKLTLCVCSAAGVDSDDEDEVTLGAAISGLDGVWVRRPAAPPLDASLVNSTIVYRWGGAGWCVGQVMRQLKPAARVPEEKRYNYEVFYEDGDRRDHRLDACKYAVGTDADVALLAKGAWVVIERASDAA